MRNPATQQDPAVEAAETREWLDSLDFVLQTGGVGRAAQLLRQLDAHARQTGARLPFSANTPYVNTIPAAQQPPFPGNQLIERRIKSLVRWNALSMVVRANKLSDGIGGHISTFASAATLYEVGFNHFFRGRTDKQDGDIIYFQGHAAPGIYARAFLEGRLSAQQLENFRRENAAGGGLSSYPHPWLMPDFWQFPTVSMGLGPIMAIYQARFNRYLEDRGLKKPSNQKVIGFLGDGETDEPETLGAITLGSREKLDNLIFVINCNLQRLDGPVRGNGQIIQELEGIFRGAGWNVLKVLWGSDWDPLFAKDREGILADRLGQIVDGQYQKYAVEDGAYMRQHLFGADPRLLDLVRHLSDDDLKRLRLGGHDPVKVYSAFSAAYAAKGQPTVILARTIKGYGLGEAGEGKNITHQQKKLNEDELRTFRKRFDIALNDEELAKSPFYRPDEESAEMRYLRERRQALGGHLPARILTAPAIKPNLEPIFEEFFRGTGDRKVSTTMVFVKMLAKLLRDKEIGKLVVPIVPDEARTFGMESLFRAVGIYSHAGQLYEPVDIDTLLYYKEAKDGQILEEGITEAGSLSSFIAAGTAYATHGVNAIPFFIYYSMFGFQRVGDLIWAAGDSRCRGFLLGGTAGRTTLAGEGLQHQDGNSLVYSLAYPNVISYDPAYAYELAVIIQDGIRRMYGEQESVFYYLTVMNEAYEMAAMPDVPGVREGIVKGLYRMRPAAKPKGKLRAQLLGSGAILPEVLKAQAILAEQFNVHADVWSATSYGELYREGHACERWNLLHPGDEPRVPYVTQAFAETQGPIVAASDYLKALPDLIDRWLPRPLLSLGTDGFGRSESRAALRSHFEVDSRFVTVATLSALARDKQIDAKVVAQAIKDFDINPDKINPAIA